MEVQTIIGSFCGLAGIVLVFLPEVTAVEASPNVLLAVLMGVIATYFASIGNIVSAHIQKIGIGVIPSNTLGMLYGTAIMLAYAILNPSDFNFDPSFSYVISLVYLSIFGSALAFTLYLTLVGRIGPEKAAYASVLFPIVALTLSTLFESYTWSALAGVGVVLVLIGNVIVLTSPTQLREHYRRLISSSSS